MNIKMTPWYWPKLLILACIRIYRYIISPCLPPSCRFTPTCSRYALEAVERYGLVKGLYLSARRVVRCHPFCSGGYDPLP